MLLPALVPLDDASRTSEVRRLALAAAGAEGLGDEESGQLAIIATELATNGIKHAQGCEILVGRLSRYDRPGVEILAVDRGPGMANVDACRSDGYSTTGTPGTGLGAIARLADEFDAYSQPGKGTVVVARKFLKGAAPPPQFRFACVCVPYRGEQACGDAWTVRRNGSSLSVLMADGLGHGALAADAALAAVNAFDRATSNTPAELLQVLHGALRGTRGAAVGVARIEPAAGTLRYAGLGNIAGVIAGFGKSQYLVSHNGTAGHEVRRCQEFEYVLPASGLLILHSDGLTTSWNLDTYAGLARRHPALVAGILYRDANRGRDDVCVVVGRSEVA